MSDSVLGNWFGNDILRQYLVENDTWLSLHTGDPWPNGDTSTELIVAGYQRRPATWGASSNRTTALAAPVLFGTLQPGTIVALGLWTASVAGNLLVRWLFSPALGIADVSPLSIGVGDLAVSL